MKTPATTLRLLTGLLSLVSLAPAACEAPHRDDPTTGTLSVALRTSAGTIAYRLRAATFNITPVGASTAVASINTEDNLDATSVQQALPPGLNNVFLAPGWRLEKDFSGTFRDVTAQLVSTNPATVTITQGQITSTSFAFQTDGGEVITVGTGTLNLTIDVLDQAVLPDVISASTSASHTCVVLAGGAVRCWGMGFSGGLGYGNTNNIGDNETPASAGDVNVGGAATQVTTGSFATCVRLSTGAVRCWGTNTDGQLGLGNTAAIGDNEVPSSVAEVNVGAPVAQISASGNHVCALLTNGNVRCWGRGAEGVLGYGNTNNIGDNETPASAGDVNVGGPVAQIATGPLHTCALLTNGNVRCWGDGSVGALGYGNTNDIGDNETPASAGDVNVGGPVAQIAVGAFHTCALLTSGAVRCWGLAVDGQLGLGNTNNIGDNELPSSVLPVAFAALANGAFTPAQVLAGERHTCVRSSSNVIRCWGAAANGELGYGTTTSNIGDNELVSGILTAVQGLGTPISLALGSSAHHTCAILATGAIRCWGLGTSGQLGYGNTNNIGDNESPGGLGNVVVTTSAAPTAPDKTLPPPPASTATITLKIIGTGAVNEGGFTCASNVGVCSIQRPIGTAPIVVNADRPGGSWVGSVCTPQGSGNPSTDAVISFTASGTCTLTFP